MMGMTNVMEDVYYETQNFTDDPKVVRHPLHMTEKHYVYHLEKHENGCLMFAEDKYGLKLKSPRSLSDMCIYTVVHNIQLLENIHCQFIPSNIYPISLAEAICQREASAIEWLVSTWPMKSLRIFDVIPLEDYLDNEYLTTPLEGNEHMCLADCIISGLLRLRPEAGLKYLDFTRFEKDRKLCRELCRLPILWMEPKNRIAEDIHEIMSNTLDVTKDKVQRFLNRISFVYHKIDEGFKHGNQIAPIQILLDLKITMDDVPLGLSLQGITPFKFHSHRVWVHHIPEVGLSPYNLANLIDTQRITHFEYEDAVLPQNGPMYDSLLDCIASLKNLMALSLPQSLDVVVNESMVGQLNQTLVQLSYLHRLNFSYCNLQGQLHTLLGGLTHRLAYLNLRDTRLQNEDIFYLLNWHPLEGLRELNLSCNNMSVHDDVMLALMEKTNHLTCFSLSFCSLTIHSQAKIARHAKEFGHLKVLSMQSYVPLPHDDVFELLNICSQIKSMQKVLLFPELYAFVGSNDIERESHRTHLLASGYRYLAMKGRPDIELE